MNEQSLFSKFYKKSRSERIDALVQTKSLSEGQQAELLKQLPLSEEIAGSMIENQVATYQLPLGVVPSVLVNGTEYIVPMAIEEPSVLAAASGAAKLIAQAGGFHTQQDTRIMIGQIIISDVPDKQLALATLSEQEEDLVQLANDAYPSIVRRGGGAVALRTRWIEADEMYQTPSFLMVDVFVETLEAMGANIINTMMEALVPEVAAQTGGEAVMGILSNYATECLVTATCRIPTELLQSATFSGEEVRDRIVKATQAATVDPYRAVTHNKGIMNGIDAAVLASGNDWRAIASGAHAFASRSGQYRSLTKWSVDTDGALVGSLTLPMPVGAVGGSISFHPAAQFTHTLLNQPSAEELAAIIVSIGLGQNFSALRALVTDGIQKGHMALHARSLAISAGAIGEEIASLSALLQKEKNRNLAVASSLLQEIRAKKNQT